MTELLRTLGILLAALAPRPALARVPVRGESPRRTPTNRDKLAPRR